MQNVPVSTTLDSDIKERKRTMTKDTLYALAFRFKKTELWNKLLEQQLFAVKFSDGTIGYCSVMGSQGIHLSLGIYPGTEGLASFRKISNKMQPKLTLRDYELLLSQKCLQCSFEGKEELSPQEAKEVRAYAKAHGIPLKGSNAYPQFSWFEPSKVPWHVDLPVHFIYLREALLATLDIAAKLQADTAHALGFTENIDSGPIPLLSVGDDGVVWSTTELPEDKNPEYPSPRIEDEILTAKVRALPRSAQSLLCDVAMLPRPERDVEAEKASGYRKKEPMVAPFYPYMLLAVDQASGAILTAHVIKDYGAESDQLVRNLMERFVEIGSLPGTILLKDERTEALLKPMARLLGVKLQRKKRIKELEEAEDDLFDYLLGQDEEAMDDEDSFAGYEEDLALDMDQFGDYFDALGNPVARLESTKDSDIDPLSPRFIESVLSMVQQGKLPPEFLEMVLNSDHDAD